MGQALPIARESRADIFKRRWMYAEKVALAGRLNGVVDKETGNIVYTGICGNPERIVFQDGRLWAFKTPSEFAVGPQAWVEVRKRVQFLAAHSRRFRRAHV